MIYYSRRVCRLCSWLRPHRQLFLPSSACVCVCVCSLLTNCCWEHSTVSTQHVGWVWWIPGIVGSYLWRVYNHNFLATAYCRLQLSEIYSEAGVKPQHLVIIHRQKKPSMYSPCNIYTPLNVFFPATSSHRPRAGIFSCERSFSVSDLI